MSEFQDRERQLPAQRTPRGLSGDLRTQARLRSAPRADVAPPQAARVLSVWAGARPVNGRDFVASGAGFAIDAYAGTRTGSASYTVPEGMVCVLTDYRYWFEPLFDSVDDAAIDGSLSVDNVVVPDFTLLQHGQAIVDYQPTYVLAYAGQTIKLQVVSSAGVVFTGFRGDLRGHLLLNSGRPLAYEPGNEVLR